MYPKHFIFIFALLFSIQKSFSQFSLFKDINTSEASSNPTGFFEINSIKIFVAEDEGKFHLWRTNGTESGTQKISDLSVYSPKNEAKFFNKLFYQIVNNELYFLEVNESLQYENLWKTDGYTTTRVFNSLGSRKLFWVNGSLICQFHNSFQKIENQSLVNIYETPINFNFSGKVIIFNDKIYFFISKYVDGYQENTLTQIWSIDGNGNDLQLFEELPIDNYLDFWNSGSTASQIILLDNQIYYFRFEYNIDYSKSICLWKTNLLNGNSNLIKRMTYIDDASINSFENLRKFGNKLFFCSLKEMWVSDGTELGTLLLKTFSRLNNSERQALELNIYPENFLITNDKIYFTANDGSDDFELWVSDGTFLNTVLLKNINPTKSSEVRDFKILNNKVYFLANESELWTTDGTQLGTILWKTFPKLNDGITRETMDASQMANGQICFSNYSALNGTELWTANENFMNESLLKNVNINNNSSFSKLEASVKLNDFWYFNADDGINGLELWKTNGTFEGTQIVKNIENGAAGIRIGKMVKVNDIIFFVATKTNSKKKIQYLFKTDGTADGTFQIDLVNNEYYDFSDLTPSNNKLYFTYANQLYVCDKNSTSPILLLSFAIPTNLTPLGDKLIFTSSGTLYTSDGTPENTGLLFPSPSNEFYPNNLVCPLEFNNKVYFFGKKNNNSYEQGLFETDGTVSGTKYIIKLSDYWDTLLSNSFLFLSKTTEKMFFRVDYKINGSDGSNFIDLWTSDGSSNGTQFLKKISFPSYFGQNVKTQSLENKIIISLQNDFGGIGSQNYVIGSDGTSTNTNVILNRLSSNKGIKSFINFNGKVYFTIDSQEADQSEFLFTNGSIEGTRITGNIRSEISKSNPTTLMNFNDKILFFAETSNSGIELYKYTPTDCDNYTNKTIKSGNWDDPANWSCRQIPTEVEDVSINEGHTIILPENFTGKAKRLNVSPNATVNFSSGSKIQLSN